MLGKIGKLTSNELTKQFKKKSILIMLCIILITAIILPVGIKFINPQGNVTINLENDKMQLEYHKDNLKALEKDKTTKGEIEKNLYQAEVEFWEKKVEYEIGYNEWKGSYLEEYKTNLNQIYLINDIKAGVSKEDISKYGFNFETKVLEKYYSVSKAELNKIHDDIKKSNEEILRVIEQNDYLAYLKSEITKNEKETKEVQQAIKKMEEEIKKKGPNEEISKEIERLQKIVSNYNAEHTLLKYRYDNKIDFDNNNWKNNTLLDIEKIMGEKLVEMLSEEDFNKEAAFGRYDMTYTKYTEQYHIIRTKELNNIKANWESLQKDSPRLEYIKDARSVVDKTYDIFIMLGILMIIVVGGGIVANEFSKGTVRLLMIRPVKRWKILLSKLLATLIIGLGIAIGGTIVLVITSGFVYGFSTLSTPIIDYYNGLPVEKSYFMYMIPNFLLSCSSLIFITSLVFMISTVAKNTALAVAISTILFIGAQPLTMILAEMKLKFIINTFIPYMNMSLYRITPMFEELFLGKYGMELNMAGGALQLSVISLIFIGITFIYFMKKDIKN